MLRVFPVLLLLLQSVLGANNSGTFYNPPPRGSRKDEAYELEQVVQIRWATSMEYFSLVLWQVDKETNDYRQSEYLKTHMHGGETEYKWIVSTQRDLKNGNTFVLQLIDDDNSKNQFSTQRFNITGKGAATTTTASSTPTFSETPPTTPSTTASSSSSGLSPQTKVGVGVGVGLGGAFLIALGVVVWYFRRRAKSAAAAAVAAAAAPAPGSDVAAPVYYAPVSTMDPYKQEGIPQQPQQQGPVEVPADSGVNAELPGDRGVEVPAQPAARYELP